MTPKLQDLRDRIAIAVLQAEIEVRDGVPHDPELRYMIATHAYEMADVMLEVRGKK